MTQYDNVTKPKHYQGKHGLEVLDVVKNFIGDLEGERAFYWGNVTKYLLRFQGKNGLEDLKKARQNLDWLIEEYEGKEQEEEPVVVPDNLLDLVEEWFIERSLYEGNPVKQFLKLVEEAGELFSGIVKKDQALVYDSLGDMQVVLAGIALQLKHGGEIKADLQELELLQMMASIGEMARKLYNHTFHKHTQTPDLYKEQVIIKSTIHTIALQNKTNARQCLGLAYNEIKNRKGKLVNGVYVKEEDLKGR